MLSFGDASGKALTTATMLFLGTAESRGGTPNLYTINGKHLERDAR